MEHTLIDFYRAIEESSAKMLQAAQAKDWDGVARYEGTCAVLSTWHFVLKFCFGLPKHNA